MRRTVVTWLAWHVSVAGMLTLAGQPPGQNSGQTPAPPPDEQAILGVWDVVGLETGGRPDLDKSYRFSSFIFTSDKVILREGFNPPLEFGYVLNPKSSPKTIDLSIRGHTAYGIYKLDGDELVVCLSMGGSRPQAFTTRGRNDAEMFTLRRSIWSWHSDPTAAFSIEMPGQVRIHASEIVIQNKTLPLLRYTSRWHKEQTVFELWMVSLGQRLAGKAAETVLDEMQDHLRRQAGASAAEDSRLKLPPWQAREVSIVGRGEQTLARFYIIGDRLFVLQVRGPAANLRSHAVRFWAAFRPPPEKKMDKKKGPAAKGGMPLLPPALLPETLPPPRPAQPPSHGTSGSHGL